MQEFVRFGVLLLFWSTSNTEKVDMDCPFNLQVHIQTRLTSLEKGNVFAAWSFIHKRLLADYSQNAILLNAAPASCVSQSRSLAPLWANHEV